MRSTVAELPVSDGPEDRPADLDAVLGLVGGGGFEVVLADRPVDAQLALGDVAADGRVRPVELYLR